jgi:hypothetical protein
LDSGPHFGVPKEIMQSGANADAEDIVESERARVWEG